MSEAADDIAERKLTPKEELFIRCYLKKNFNASKAAVLAGYSVKTAAAIGSEILRKPHVKAAISKLIDELLDSEMSGLKRQVIGKYKDIAFGKGASAGDRIRALDSLSRYLHLFEEGGTHANINVYIDGDLVQQRHEA